MTAARTDLCSACGMPLAYDEATSDAPVSTAGGRCSFCTGARRAGASSRATDSRWVLDLLIEVYLGRRPGARTLARLARAAGGLLPEALRNLSAVVASVPPRATGEYDALVLYSGGKDSSYMLVDLVTRKKLRVCAWMLQQGYQSPQAIRNAEHLCKTLGIPLVIEQPPKDGMDALFRRGFSIDTSTPDRNLLRAAMTYGSACWPCFSMIAARSMAFCSEHGIPMCFIGTQEGQNRMDLNGIPVLSGRGLPEVVSLVERFIGRFAQHTADLEAASMLRLAASATVLVPFYEFVKKPDLPVQLAAIERYGWSSPTNTGGCSTNCMINELGRQVSRTRFGFDLYQIIDAHERRLGNRTSPVEAPPPLDPEAVRLGARLIALTPAERREYRLEDAE